MEIVFKNGDTKIVHYFIDVKERGNLNASQLESHVFQVVSSGFREDLIKCGARSMPTLKSSAVYGKLVTKDVDSTEYLVEKILDKMEKANGVSIYSFRISNKNY